MEDPIPADLQESGAEHILDSAITAGETLARSKGFEEALPDVLAVLGEAAGTSRAYVWRNVTLDDGRLAMDMLAEWTAPGVAPVIDDPGNHGWPYDDGYARYRELLSQGETITGLTSEFPSNERADLESEGIVSVTFVPLFVGGEWWGFLGYDDCEVERRWSSLDLKALRFAAATLSNAIPRDQLALEHRKAEELMRTHIESIPAITYMESDDPDDEKGYVDFYVSPQVATILGYTTEEWLTDVAKNWLEFVHPDDRATVEEATRRTTESGDPYDIEYRMLRSDGKWVWIADESRRVDAGDGSPPYWHGVMMDITERKRAEEQHAFHSQLLDSISDAVIAYDTNEIVMSWNRAAETLYGWGAEAMIGSPLPEEIRHDPSHLVEIWDPFVQERRGWRGTTIHRDKDGYEISVETKGLPLLDPSGQLKGYVMVNREAAES